MQTPLNVYSTENSHLHGGYTQNNRLDQTAPDTVNRRTCTYFKWQLYSEPPSDVENIRNVVGRMTRSPLHSPAPHEKKRNVTRLCRWRKKKNDLKYNRKGS